MELLEKLCASFAPSGEEKDIRDIIYGELRDFADEIKTDAMGNLILHKTGKGKKVLFAAPMDECGIMVTFVEDDGNIRFHPIGALEAKKLIGKRIKFRDGTAGVVCMKEEKEKPSFNDLYIDTAEKSNVNTGVSGVIDGGYTDSDEAAMSKGLSRASACYALISALKDAEKFENDIYIVFTAQNEVGYKGAMCAANEINADAAIVIYAAKANDSINIKTGGGAVIKIKDDSIICDSGMINLIKNAAEKDGIRYQTEVSDEKSSAGAVHLSGSGAKCSAIGIPVKHKDYGSEIVKKEDIMSAKALIEKMAGTKIDL